MTQFNSACTQARPQDGHLFEVLPLTAACCSSLQSTMNIPR